MIDQLFLIMFESAQTAIFELGSIMAVLMLAFGILDYKKGDQLRDTIIHKKLDRPSVMLGLSLIPVDGTLLFQYSAYRRGSIRFGSLLAGIIGIGEESTYLIWAYQPLAWFWLVVIKAVIALPVGFMLNKSKTMYRLAEKLTKQDQTDPQEEELLAADENFHELPDKFRHKLHHFRYHTLGKAFWIFFAAAFLVKMLLLLLDRLQLLNIDEVIILDVPILSWMGMVALFIVVFYSLIIRMTTREFGKIFEHEFEDVIDAIGDLAETCANIILIIFVMTFAVQGTIHLIGLENIEALFAGRGALAVLLAALIGLIPGTGASLAFTALYFALSGTQGALPFAALAACSIALIGDSQFIGARQIRQTQKTAHAIAFGLALTAGYIIYFVEMLLNR